MAENDVTIQINVEAKDAQAAIELFGKESVKVLNKVEKSNDSLFSSIKNAAFPIAGAVASITGAFSLLSGAIEEANADAKLTRQIGASLLATGESGQAAIQGVIDFADVIKETTGLSDDLAKQTFITAKSFGIGTEQAKKLTLAAIDLASATGIDVETAVRQLGGTLDGSIGKIGNLGFEFRNLTEEQAKAGNAIDLVSKKFGGTAAKELDTYQGSVNELSNAFSDLLKSIGKVVTESNAREIGSNFASVINDISASIDNFRKENTISLTGIGFISLKKELKDLGDIDFGKTSKEISKGFAGIVESEIGATKATADFEDRLKSFAANTIKSVGLTGRALEDHQKKLKALSDEGKKFVESILSGFGSRAETEANKTRQAILSVEDQLKKGTISTQKANELKLLIAQDFNRKTEEENKRFREKEQQEQEKAINEALKAAADARVRIEQAASQPIKFAIDQKGALDSKEIGASVVGGIGLALKGKAGAIDAVSQTFAGIGDAILPGIGGAVGGLAQLLAQGPEATKKFIKEFINSIPDIIQAIAESIPVVVEVFVDTMVNRGGAARIGIAIAKAMAGQAIFARLGEQIFGKSGDELAKVIQSGATEYAKETQDSFTQAIQSFGPTMASGLQDLGTTLVESFQGFDDLFNNALDGFVDNLASEFGYFFSTLGSSLFTFVASFPIALVNGVAEAVRTIFTGFDPLIGALRSLQSAVEKAGGVAGKGGGQGLIAEGAAKLGKALGFAQGGIVPLYAASGAFVPKGTDTVPAMLTPGELVVPRDMVGELGSFLSMQNGNSNTSDTAMIAAILSAVQAPIVVKTEAKVNQNAFADIILQLNRQNARMTA